MPNRDKTMDDIKNGKGLPQLSSAEGSNHQTGITTEQRAEKGITYETFTYHGEKRSNREQLFRSRGFRLWQMKKSKIPVS